LVGYNSIDFYVNGDANRYYPVLLSLGGQFGMNRYSVSRGYSDPAPWDPIGTGSHRGGLTLTFDASSDIAWGGNDKSWRIIQFAESYTNMVAGMALPVTGGILVWLRGGGAYYRFQGPNGINHSADVYYDGYTGANGANYPVRTDLGSVDGEIRSKWPIRGYGDGDIYVNNNAVIHAGNIGSQSVNYASSAGAVAWGNVSSRPTALSQFSNDLGNYGGWITSSGSISGNAATVTVNSGNGSASWYPILWHSGNNVYSSSGVAEIYPAGGYGRFQYINTTDNDESGITRFVIKNGDSYHRSATTTVAADIIRGVASGSWSITAARATRANGNFYIDDNYGNTVVGVYASTRLQGVWAMGDAYKLSADGTNAGNLYGLAWSHPNAGGQAGFLSNHGLIMMMYGTAFATLSDTIWCRGDIIAFSDARVKTNIQRIENPIDKIMAIRGVTFTRTDIQDKEKRHAGVIAQEVLEVLPEVVNENKDSGHYSVAYGNLSALLIEAIKEQQQQIEELKAEVKKLRGE